MTLPRKVFHTLLLSAAVFVFAAVLIETVTGAAAEERGLPPHAHPTATPPAPRTGQREETYAQAAAAIAAAAYRNGVRLDALSPVGPAATGPFDSSITGLYVRYAKAVGFGQITPQSVRIPWDVPADAFDRGAALAKLHAAGLDAALAFLPPPHPAYRRLVVALARYRRIAAAGGWPMVPGGPALRRGDDGARVAVLRRRLAAEGDLSAAHAGGTAFDARLEQAVVRFQRRLGLEPDGLVGPKTLAALDVPVTRRIEQIIANLERWRWMPQKLPLPRVVVNVAAAELRVVDAGGNRVQMRVVVGDPHHPTPLFASRIRAVVLDPSWNVPVSIWTHEILPRLRHDPDYLAQNDMRIVERPDDPYGFAIDWHRKADIPPGIHVRQEPGPGNALGRVKFDIPNRFGVYLHDTPARSLFDLPKRALSHGCVRLQKPEALLRYLFRTQDAVPRLPPAAGGPAPVTRTIAVPKPLPVFLTYRTAFVTPDDVVHFRNDLYGYDARITAALSRQGGTAGRESRTTGCRA